MAEVKMEISVPEHSAKIADAMAELTMTIVANRKAGMNVATEVTADITAAVTKLSGVLSSFDDLPSEAKDAPIGFAQAFTLAGFKVARGLTGK